MSAGTAYEIATDDIMNEPVEKNKLCRIGTIIPVRQNVNTFTKNGGSYEEESYGSTSCRSYGTEPCSLRWIIFRKFSGTG
jgi:hypothetical protein